MRGCVSMLLRVQAAGSDGTAWRVAADAVGGLAEETELRRRVTSASACASACSCAACGCCWARLPRNMPRSARQPGSRRSLARGADVDGCASAPAPACPSPRPQAFTTCASIVRQWPPARRSPCSPRHQQIIVGRMHDVDLRAALGGLAQAMRDQRMILAQEGADHQHAVELRHVGDLHAQPRRAGRLPSAEKSALAQAEIDVVAAQSAHELLRAGAISSSVACGARERADRLRRRALSGCRASRSRHDRARSASRPRASAPPCFSIGLGQALLGVQALIREAVLVRDPALVDRLVLAAAARA